MAHYLATGEGPVLGKRLELPALRADGTEFPVELAITRIPTEGPPLFTAYLRDITEAKRSEQHRNARLAVVERSVEQLAQQGLSCAIVGGGVNLVRDPGALAAEQQNIVRLETKIAEAKLPETAQKQADRELRRLHPRHRQKPRLRRLHGEHLPQPRRWLRRDDLHQHLRITDHDNGNDHRRRQVAQRDPRLARHRHPERQRPGREAHRNLRWVHEF